MIQTFDRKIAFRLWKLGAWKLDPFMFRSFNIIPCWGTGWLLEMMLKRQVVDDLHHAPACPANHYHKRRLVFDRCTCGAQACADQQPSPLRANETNNPQQSEKGDTNV